jgi:predicted nucleotidyltransferase
VARAEDGVESDIDVAVVINAPPYEVGRIADTIRDRLFEESRAMAFSPSVVSMTPAELHQLKDDRAPMWTDLLRDTRVLVGPSPEALLRSAPGPEKDA